MLCELGIDDLKQKLYRSYKEDYDTDNDLDYKEYDSGDDPDFNYSKPKKPTKDINTTKKIRKGKLKPKRVKEENKKVTKKVKKIKKSKVTEDLKEETNKEEEQKMEDDLDFDESAEVNI